MSQPSTSPPGSAGRSPSAPPAPTEPKANIPRTPGKPAFGFLLGGTTLGIFIGCVLLCAGARPPEVIIILLSIVGAVIGGVLESIWPANSPRTPPAPRKIPFKAALSHHECHRCGEVFTPPPITCPMCGHTDKRERAS